MKKLLGCLVGIGFSTLALGAVTYDATLNTADTSTSMLSFSDASHWTFIDPTKSCAPNTSAAEGLNFYMDGQYDLYVPKVTTGYNDNIFYGALYACGTKRIFLQSDTYVWFKGGLHLSNNSIYLDIRKAGTYHVKGDLYWDSRPAYISLGDSTSGKQGDVALHLDGNIGGASRFCVVTANTASGCTKDETFYVNGTVTGFTGAEVLWSQSQLGYLYMVFAEEASFPTVTTSFNLSNGAVFRTCKQDSVNTIKTLTLVRENRANGNSSQLDPVNNSTIVVDGACTMQSADSSGGRGLYWVPTNGTVRIKNLTINAGATLRATYTGAANPTSCQHPIEVTTGLTLPSGQIGLRFDYAKGAAVGPNGGPSEVQFLKVPTSVKALTTDMFKIVQGRLEDVPYDFMLPVVTNIAIRTEGDYQIVCAYPRDVVRALKEHTTSSCMLRPEVWSDNQTVHAGADYYSAYKLNFGSAAFTGESMSFNTGMSVGFINCDDFRFNGYQFQCYNGLTWMGSTRLIASTTGGAANVLVYSANVVSYPISTSFSGPGDLAFIYRGHKTDSCKGGRVYLTGDNSDWSGVLKVWSQDVESGKTEAQWLNDSDWNVTLFIENEKNLGGALSAFTYNGLLLQDWACLAVTNDVSLSDNNRGIMIYKKARLDVASGKTLAVNRPIVYSGLLRKDGAGTLALGARPRFCGSLAQDTPVAGTNLLVVKEGAIKPLSTVAFASVDVTFSNDTAIAVNLTGSDADLLAKGLVSTGTLANVSWPTGTVSVRFDGSSPFSDSELVTVGVITLQTQAEAQTALGKLVAGHVTGGKATLRVADAANADGTWSVLADLRKRGGIIFLR